MGEKEISEFWSKVATRYFGLKNSLAKKRERRKQRFVPKWVRIMFKRKKKTCILTQVRFSLGLFFFFVFFCQMTPQGNDLWISLVQRQSCTHCCNATNRLRRQKLLFRTPLDSSNELYEDFLGFFFFFYEDVSWNYWNILAKVYS